MEKATTANTLLYRRRARSSIFDVQASTGMQNFHTFLCRSSGCAMSASVREASF